MIENIERAFLFAGARSALAGLWLASDTFTTDLIRQFYRNLAAGEDEGEALRSAKLTLMKTFGSKATPFDWAGFTLVGDASTQVDTIRGIWAISRPLGDNLARVPIPGCHRLQPEV